MSRKLGLKIDTQFYGEQQNSYDRENQNMQYSPTFPVQKMTSAAMFERLLSSNLAEKFIDCWKTLKNPHSKIRQHFKTDSYLRPEDQRRYNQASSSRKYNGQKSGEKYMHTGRYNKNTARQAYKEEERVIYRNKSADLRVDLSRAQILNKIAEKLKQNRVLTPKSEKNDYEVSQRLSKLERLMKEIRVTNQISNEKAINSRISYEKKQKDQLEILKMLEEVTSLKREIKDIKQQNQQILKSESERIRSSSIRQTIYKDNNHLYPNQILYQLPYTHNVYPNQTNYQTQIRTIPYNPIHIPKNIPNIHGNYIQISKPTYRPMENQGNKPTIVTSKPQYKPQYKPINSLPGGNNSNFLRAPSLESNPNRLKIPINNPMTFSINNYSSVSNWKPKSDLINNNNIVTKIIRKICEHCGRNCGCQPINHKF